MVFTAAFFTTTLTLTAQVVSFDVGGISTVPSVDNNNDGFNNNGIWFTMTNGTPLVVSNDTFPGYVDGQFQLRTQEFLDGNAAEFLIQGLFANGNAVAVPGSGAFPSNPAYLPFGSVIGPDSTFLDSGAFVALSGAFGNWITSEPLRGVIGVRFGNEGNIHYGFADITIDADSIVTLHGYAFESTPNTAITAVMVPEPSTYAVLLGALALAVVAVRRRLVK